MEERRKQKMNDNEEIIKEFEELHEDNDVQEGNSEDIEVIEAEEIPGTERNAQGMNGFQQVFQFSGNGQGAFFSVFSSGPSGGGNIRININGQEINLENNDGERRELSEMLSESDRREIGERDKTDSLLDEGEKFNDRRD